MMSNFETARQLLRKFKGNDYCFGNGVLSDVGRVAAKAGKNALLVYAAFPGVEAWRKTIRQSHTGAGLTLLAEVEGARPNAPREDVFRIQKELAKHNPDVVISFGGGSTIDAVKAAETLRTLGGDIEQYFGVGKVTEAVEKIGRKLTPHVAIQTAASSAAHLTKYSNITDPATGQKKLIVDPAVVPAWPMFDYRITHDTPADLTADGAMDGIAHCVEVFYGTVGKPYYAEMEEITEAAVTLVLEYLPAALKNPRDEKAREALCLATDLGGYAIMLGGTNGGHLTSFSLVDILSHGRACAIMNPYYTVFFAPAIEDPLHLIGRIFHKAGYIAKDPATLSGRALGLAVADGMFAFARRVGFPTRLSEVKGFADEHIRRALTAAKNPQLKMKLENMPVPLTAEMIDEFMAPILESARDGKLEKIKNVS
jgi:alcohol dehydrogenase